MAPRTLIAACVAGVGLLVGIMLRFEELWINLLLLTGIVALLSVAAITWYRMWCEENSAVCVQCRRRFLKKDLRELEIRGKVELWCRDCLGGGVCTDDLMQSESAKAIFSGEGEGPCPR